MNKKRLLVFAVPFLIFLLSRASVDSCSECDSHFINSVGNDTMFGNLTIQGDLNVTGLFYGSFNLNNKSIKDYHIDWGTGVNQVNADDIPDGSTNVIISSTQESNYNDAYSKRVDNWTSPLQFNSNTASITQANPTTDGYLSSTDWNAFQDAYGKRVDTWGDGLTYSLQTASVDYNSVNLKITSGQLNTIQDISTSSNPSFSGINVNTISNKDNPYVVFNGKAVFVKNGASNSDIQSALNYLKSQYGGTLYLMSGNYYISSTLLVENNVGYQTNINIVGIGKPILVASSTTNYIMKTLGSYVTIQNIEFYITGTYPNGLYLGSSDTKITNCRFYDTSTTAGYLIRVFGDGSDNIIITNNIFRGGNYQVEFRDAQNNVVFSNNIMTDFKYGIIMRQNTNRFTITGNSLRDYSNVGIYIQGDRGVINSNAGYVSGKNLIYLHSYADANAVVGNNGQILNSGTNNVLSGNRE